MVGATRWTRISPNSRRRLSCGARRRTSIADALETVQHVLSESRNRLWRPIYPARRRRRLGCAVTERAELALRRMLGKLAP